MVHSCSAYNCTKRYQKGSGIPVTFHNFPKERKIRDEWLHEMRRIDWQPSTKSKLCSQHFTESCYEQAAWSSQRRLKPDAIPTIFDFSEHLKKQIITSRRSPKKCAWTDESVIQAQDSTAMEAPALEEPDATILKKRRCYLGDYLNKDESLKDCIGSQHFERLPKLPCKGTASCSREEHTPEEWQVAPQHRQRVEQVP